MSEKSCECEVIYSINVGYVPSPECFGCQEEEPKMANRNCSKSDCERVANVYAGGPHSGDWADYYCNDHIPTGFRVWDKLAPVCPSCSGFIPNNETPGAYPGAISRKDNKTEICSACGTAEALADFFKNK